MQPVIFWTDLLHFPSFNRTGLSCEMWHSGPKTEELRIKIHTQTIAQIGHVQQLSSLSQELEQSTEWLAGSELQSSKRNPIQDGRIIGRTGQWHNPSTACGECMRNQVAASKQESSQIGSLNAKLSLYTAFLRAKTAWVNFFLLISDLTVFNLSERETFRSFCQIFSSVKEPSLNDLWSSATFEAANSDVEIIRFLMKPKAEACSTLLQNLHLQRPKMGNVNHD